MPNYYLLSIFTSVLSSAVGFQTIVASHSDHLIGPSCTSLGEMPKAIVQYLFIFL